MGHSLKVFNLISEKYDQNILSESLQRRAQPPNCDRQNSYYTYTAMCLHNICIYFHLNKFYDNFSKSETAHRQLANTLTEHIFAFSTGRTKYTSAVTRHSEVLYQNIRGKQINLLLTLDVWIRKAMPK